MDDYIERQIEVADAQARRLEISNPREAWFVKKHAKTMRLMRDVVRAAVAYRKTRYSKTWEDLQQALANLQEHCNDTPR